MTSKIWIIFIWALIDPSVTHNDSGITEVGPVASAAECERLANTINDASTNIRASCDQVPSDFLFEYRGREAKP